MANLAKKCLVERGVGGGEVVLTVCYLSVYCVAVWILLSWNPLHSDTFAIAPRNAVQFSASLYD